MSKLNFKLRTIIYFTLAAVIPFLISWYFIYQIIDTKLQKDLEQMYEIYVHNQVSKIDQTFARQEDILQSIANSYSYISENRAAINSFLIQQSRINKQFKNIYIVMNDGKIILGDESIKIPDMDFMASHTYVSAMKAQRLTWLEPYTDILSGERCIGIAIPINNRHGAVEGVLIGNISEEAFSNMLADAKYLPNVNMLLINSSGYVKFDSKDKYSESTNINDSSFILNSVSNNIMNFHEGSHEIEFENKTWLCIFSSIDSNYWKIASLLDTNEIKASVSVNNSTIFNYIIILGFVAMMLVILFAFFLSNSITKPLLKLRDGARAVAVGNLDYKIHIESKDEIKELADSFNDMSYNLKKSYEELFNRTEELFKNNQYLQEINTELEASYQQLGATMLQLNESEEKYRKLMSNISDMVFVFNSDLMIVYINNKMEKTLGFSESELLGRPVSIIFRDELEESPLCKAFTSNYTEYQLELVKKDGSLLTVEGSAQRVIEDDRVIGIQAIARDITQRKQIEQQLAKKYNELQVLNRVSKAIANTLDLNNLLYAIVNQVIDVSDALVCSIRLFDSLADNNLVLKAIDGVKTHRLNVDDIIINKELIEQSINKKQSVSLELTLNDLNSEYMKMLFKEEYARYVSFHPLVVQGNAIGIMSTVKRSMPSYEQMELLDSLANSVAIAIDNATAYENLKQSYIKTVQSLVSAVEAKDVYTESHSIRVANYACFIASEMGYTKAYLEDIWVAGVLHDIGKIGISDLILNKKDRLTIEEYEIVKQHPSISCKIVSKIGLKDEIIDAVKHHHERYDGNGYPEGLKGSEISTMSSIISVADAFDAITSERSYKKAKTIRQGITEIVVNRGMQFDPKVVDIFERAYLMKSSIIEKIYNNEEVDFF